MVTEFRDEFVVAVGDGKVIYVNAEVDAASVQVESEEKARVVDGSFVVASEEECRELVVESLWCSVESVQRAPKSPYWGISIYVQGYQAGRQLNVDRAVYVGGDECAENVEAVKGE